jgi:hypothetical protein
MAHELQTMSEACTTLNATFATVQTAVAGQRREALILREVLCAMLRELAPLIAQVDSHWKGEVEALAPTVGPTLSAVQQGYPELASL